MLGKIPLDVLKKIIYDILEKQDESLILPSKIGEDAGAFLVNQKQAVLVHSDPITATGENVGWLAIHIAANDVASSGAFPKWYTVVILLPENTSHDNILKIAKDIRKALDEIGGIVIGGHTEYTSSVKTPIVIATAIGVQDKNNIIYTGGAKEGDYLILTKTAGLEATAVLAYEKEIELQKTLSRKEIEFAKSFIKNISVLKEAILLADNKLANSMHDPTEGGIIAAAVEIALASKKSVLLWKNKVPIHPLTKKILGIYDVDPLKSLSSGSLLATIPKDKVDRAIAMLEESGIKATIIGMVKDEKEPKLTVVDVGEKKEYKQPPLDDLILKLSS